MTPFKKRVHKAYIRYLERAPIERGKYRLGVLLYHAIGTAPYEVDGVTMLLCPVSLIDRKLITGAGHDRFVVERMLRALRDGGHFVDVGANIGYMSLVAGRALGDRGTVYSFEPSAREFARLRRNIDLNRLRNVVAIGKGIAPRRETSTLFVAGLDNPAMSSRFEIRSLRRPARADFVPVEDAIPASELPRVRCVKVDVEGDEVSVLRAFEPHMHLLNKATFLVEITENFLRKAGHAPEDVYGFFAAHALRPLRHTRDAIPPGTQYDEAFVPEDA